MHWQQVRSLMFWKYFLWRVYPTFREKTVHIMVSSHLDGVSDNILWFNFWKNFLLHPSFFLVFFAVLNINGAVAFRYFPTIFRMEFFLAFFVTFQQIRPHFSLQDFIQIYLKCFSILWLLSATEIPNLCLSLSIPFPV